MLVLRPIGRGVVENKLITVRDVNRAQIGWPCSRTNAVQGNPKKRGVHQTSADYRKGRGYTRRLGFHSCGNWEGRLPNHPVTCGATPPRK